VDAVEDLASVAVNYHVCLYRTAEVSAAGMAVVQRVVKDIGDAFTDVKTISQSFLPALFGDDFDEDDPRLV
jgi:hypothetical protein